MPLTASSALPLQKETTDKKKRPMSFGQFFAGGGEDEKDKAPTQAEKTAADWIKPGGGYDQWKKDDPAREKVLPPGGSVPEGYKPGMTRAPQQTMPRYQGKNFAERKPLKEALPLKSKPAKRKTIGQMIAESD